MPLIVLESDGIINQLSDKPISSPDQWLPLPNSLEAIARLNRAHYQVAVTTNQALLSGKDLDIDAVTQIHSKMRQMVANAGGTIESILYCPHEAKDQCHCRKPKPGLLDNLASRLGVDLKGTPVVENSIYNLQAGASLGARVILVSKKRDENWADILPGGAQEIEVYPNLSAVADALLESENNLIDI